MAKLSTRVKLNDELKESAIKLFESGMTVAKVRRELNLQKVELRDFLLSHYGDKFYELRSKNRSKLYSGTNNPNYGVKASEETLQKMRMSQLGKKVSEDSKRKMSLSHKKRFEENPELRMKVAEPLLRWTAQNDVPWKGKRLSESWKENLRKNSHVKKYGRSKESVEKSAQAHRGMKRSKQSRELMSKTRADKFAHGELKLYTNNLRGIHKSSVTGREEYYHSSWELKRMEQLDDIGVSWTKDHGICIPYEVDGIMKQYVPDFLVNYPNLDVIEEVKGWYNDSAKLKEQAALKYCAENGLKYVILMKAELFSDSVFNSGEQLK